jgi:hypothetical protein
MKSGLDECIKSISRQILNWIRLNQFAKRKGHDMYQFMAFSFLEFIILTTG